MPGSRAGNPRRLDLPGQLLVIALLGCLATGIIEGPRSGWGSAPVAALFAVAVLAAVALAVVESRRREPLVDMRYFRSTPFSGAALIGVAALATLGGFLFLNTLYLQDVSGGSALHAGCSPSRWPRRSACSPSSQAGWWPAAGRGFRWPRRAA